MKNIAIDCRALTWERSGIARYLLNILSVLFKIDKQNNYYLLSPYPLSVDLKYANVHAVVLPGNFFAYKFVQTPNFLRQNTIDTYWSPTQELPLSKVAGCHYVISMHDIANELHKDWVGWNIRLMTYAGLYKRSACIADTVLAVTNSVKKDIEAFYHTNPEKIEVTYEGYDPLFTAIEKKEAQRYVAKKFSITNDYIFYINTVKAKNLLIAFADLMNHEWRNKKVTLICLGKFKDQKDNPVILAGQFGITKYVKAIEEFVTDNDVNYLYSGSEFFISPSFYEGFGLTPLEALRSGTAVTVSDIPTHREVFKDIPLYFDPYNPNDIKEKMLKIYKNDKEKDRMLSDAKKLYMLYNWKKVASIVYQTLIKK